MAARLDDEAFWAGLARLGEGAWHLGRRAGDVHEHDSVAARLDDEAFWAGLARLGELGISGDRLVTF